MIKTAISPIEFGPSSFGSEFIPNYDTITATGHDVNGNPATVTLIKNGAVVATYAITYTSLKPTLITNTQGGSVVETITLTWNGINLTSIVRS
jgi:hypothetical protein